MRTNILLTILGGFMGGVILRSFFDFGMSFAFFIFFLGAVFFLYYLYTRAFTIALVSLGIVGAFLGVLRFDIADRQNGDPFLDARVNEVITLEGIVVSEPDVRETRTLLTVLMSPDEDEEVREKVLLSAPLYPKWQYGDRVRATGKLTHPKNFLNENGKEFNYQAFLEKDNIFYKMTSFNAEPLGRGEGNVIKRTLFSFKRGLLENIARVIPEPEASLLGGLVVGAKQSLGPELLDDFRATGIIHIVVLSGYNVTIVAESLMRFFSFLPRLFSLWVGAGSIILFAIMTGGGATIVRASIMALLVVVARATGRVYDMTIALLVAGTLMVLVNPKILMFDVSFQLSFLATLGLMYLPPLFEKYFTLIPETFQLRQFALATVATQIFVLPLLLFKMGELSLVALPVNLLILTFVPLTMLFGFLAGMAGFVSTFLSLPFAFIAHGLLSYELWVVDVFARFPFASVSISFFPLLLMLLMYAWFGWLVHRAFKRGVYKEKIEEPQQ